MHSDVPNSQCGRFGAETLFLGFFRIDRFAVCYELIRGRAESFSSAPGSVKNIGSSMWSIYRMNKTENDAAEVAN